MQLGADGVANGGVAECNPTGLVMADPTASGPDPLAAWVSEPHWSSDGGTEVVASGDAREGGGWPAG